METIIEEREYFLPFKDCVLTLERAAGSELSCGVVGSGIQRAINANPEDSIQFNSL